ncbi:hypothetical protein F2P81_002207 [Scophthalmus maximus]|uniref:Uncharacterized protein n=1 Tax=Scophthalmus maximus TaxID=52904 RepID=A0A6A4TMT2_SCOMX|nr:hypothetical protein F2P81_002207 [Scophthalmus maximus]
MPGKLEGELLNICRRIPGTRGFEGDGAAEGRHRENIYIYTLSSSSPESGPEPAVQFRCNPNPVEQCADGSQLSFRRSTRAMCQNINTELYEKSHGYRIWGMKDNRGR